MTMAQNLTMFYSSWFISCWHESAALLGSLNINVSSPMSSHCVLRTATPALVRWLASMYVNVQPPLQEHNLWFHHVEPSNVGCLHTSYMTGNLLFIRQIKSSFYHHNWQYKIQCALYFTHRHNLVDAAQQKEVHVK